MYNEGFTSAELAEISELTREPVYTHNPDNHIRIFLVGPHIHFAITDVFVGYAQALQKMNMDVFSYPTYQFKAFFSDEMLMRYIHSYATDPREGFTHVGFIGGLWEARWWLTDSLKVNKIKTFCITTEDPHQLDQNELLYKSMDLYFSNEREVPKVFPGAKYLPTAASLEYCRRYAEDQMPKKFKEEFSCDILHLGTLYPYRIEFLKKIAPWVEQNKFKMIITGCGNKTGILPRELHKYFVPRDKVSYSPGIERAAMLNHADVVMLYNTSKIVLNINRKTIDIDRNISSNKKFKIEGESLNPRCYEVPMCGSILATDKERIEYKKIFGEEDDKILAFENEEEFQNKASVILKDDKKLLAMQDKAHEFVMKNHTYQNRAARLMRFILINSGYEGEALSFALRHGVGIRK